MTRCRRRSWGAALVLGLGGCTGRPATGEDGSGGSSGSATGTAVTSGNGTDGTTLEDAEDTSADVTGMGEVPPPCARLVDDIEDGDAVLRDDEGQRQGAWYLWPPGVGIDPAPLVQNTGAAGSSWSIGSDVGYLFVDLNAPDCVDAPCSELERGTIDASQWQGLSFWARVDEPIELADFNLCAGCTAERSACTSLPGRLLLPTTQWQQFWIDFADVPSQPCDFDPSELTAIVWTEHPDTETHLWIDEVCFY